MSDQTSWASNVSVEEVVEQISGPESVAPSGEVRAFSSTLDDELVTYRCDLDEARPCQEGVFNVAQHRRNEHYRAIAGQAAAVLPKCDGDAPARRSTAERETRSPVKAASPSHDVIRLQTTEQHAYMVPQLPSRTRLPRVGRECKTQ